MKKMDPYLLFPYLFLLIVGVLMIYSASADVAVNYTGNSYTFFRNQLIYTLLGIIALLLFSRIKYSILTSKRLMIVLLTFMFALLIAVLATEEINGASRWISIGFFNLQPVEFAKLILLWYVAFILSKKQKVLQKNWLQAIAPAVIIFLLTAFFIFLQPDTGGVIIIATVTMVQIFASGLPFFVGLLTSIFLSFGSLLYVYGIYLFGEKIPGMSAYRLERFHAFWSPFELANGSGLQLVQSYYAVGNGSVMGKGFGMSIQKLGYLPEPHTDFILAIIAEELGLIGVALIIGALFLLILRIIYVGIHSNDSFSGLICYGVGTLLLIQCCINISGVVGLLPISGMTLPFISYGGSSLLISSAALGLVMNVARKSNLERLKNKKARAV